jgi:hypothetical protein
MRANLPVNRQPIYCLALEFLIVRGLICDQPTVTFVGNVVRLQHISPSLLLVAAFALAAPAQGETVADLLSGRGLGHQRLTLAASRSDRMLSGDLIDLIDPEAGCSTLCPEDRFAPTEALLGGDGMAEMFRLGYTVPRLADPAYAHNRPRRVAPFPIELNQTVRAFVDQYLDHSESLQLAFDRSAPYLDLMASKLEHRGVPRDFIYLSFAESDFTGRGAGPWQLTKATAKQFGLRIDKFVDERRDPIKSTEAAAEYLATLHDQYNDWRLAVVGWNTGIASLVHFIEVRGADYDRMASRLPTRTKQLMNRFMAVAFIAHDAEAYGIRKLSLDLPILGTVKVRGGTSLRRIAQMNDTSVAAIKRLNPSLLRDSVPPNAKFYEVMVPREEPVDTDSL